MSDAIKLPFKVEVIDYHDLQYLQTLLRQGNPKVKVREAGFNGRYLGLVYSGRLTDSKNAKILEELKEESKAFDIEMNRWPF
jgi:hypothetical protein